MLAFLRAAALNAVSAALAVLTAAFPAAASTNQVTLTSTAWTLLGSGPMTVAVASSGSNTTNAKQILFQSSAVAPTASTNFGLPLSVEAQNYTNNLNFQGSIYAKVLTNDGNAGALVVNVATSGGSVGSVAINQATAATTQLVPAAAGYGIYVNGFHVTSAGATTVTFEYGTGTNCGSGTTTLTGAMTLNSGTPLSPSAGSQPILVIPANNALCIVNGSPVQISGSLSYSQF